MTIAMPHDVCVWDPSVEGSPAATAARASNVARLAQAHGFASVAEFSERSWADPAWFWDLMARELKVTFDTPYSSVLEAEDPRFPRWFTGGTLNIAYDCVVKHALGPLAARPAVVWEGEDGGTRTLSFADLRREVSLLASSMRDELGVQPGDAVAIYLPMVPEVVVAMYACAAIGALAVPIFSGFAAEAVALRLAHSKAKVVLTCDGTYRRGRTVMLKSVIDDARKAAPSLEHVVVQRRLGVDVAMHHGDTFWHELTAHGDATYAPEWLDSEHPWLLAYTSGTTGTPKAAVHVHGGFLVKIAEEALLQTDVREGETLFWVTDMGWIMGPWEIVGAHANGASVVIYEGAPDYPAPDRLWELAARHKVNVLGVSPTLIRALKSHGDDLPQRHDLSSLRILASTGEPWNPEPWQWLFDVVGKGRCPIINLSGGTEVGACFLSPMPTTPLKPCTLGQPALGMAMEVRDGDGHPLGPGEGVGELVCTKPWPAQTRAFWGEGGRERYLDAYWGRWADAWVHGDWASIDEDGLWFLHGRSDDTINVAGKRIGPAEYESILVDHESVQEAAAIGVPDEVKGETVWCYVVLAPGKRATDRLRENLRELVAERLGKAFTPSAVYVVNALPKTRSAKIVRRAIRATALGEDPGDISTIENPQSLREIAKAR